MREGKLMPVIAITNQKGGVSKTSTAVNLAGALAKKGRHVLIVDMDPQGAVATAFGYLPDLLKPTIYEVFFRGVTTKEAIWAPQQIPNIHILPSNLSMAEGEVRLISEMGREYFLKKALCDIIGDYDYVLIDCPPSLSVLSTNALVAAEYTLIPVAPDLLSLRGMENLLEHIVKVKEVLNPSLEVLGIVISMFDKRTLHAREAKQLVEREFGHQIRIFQTTVSYTTKVKDSYTAKLPVVYYDPTSTVSQQYMSLAEEVEHAIS